MDLRLQGKRALVTGSSIGLGEAIARALAAEGVAVAIHGRQPKRTYAVAADIQARGGRVAVVLGDLTVEGEAQNIADSDVSVTSWRGLPCPIFSPAFASGRPQRESVLDARAMRQNPSS